MFKDIPQPKLSIKRNVNNQTCSLTNFDESDIKFR